jgi:hypothetical protein
MQKINKPAISLTEFCNSIEREEKRGISTVTAM